MFVEDIFVCFYMDIFGLFIILIEGYKYILLIVDLFSKFFEVFFLKI